MGKHFDQRRGSISERRWGRKKEVWHASNSVLLEVLQRTRTRWHARQSTSLPGQKWWVCEPCSYLGGRNKPTCRTIFERQSDVLAEATERTHKMLEMLLSCWV